jgi:hypothetical protein
MMTMAKFQFASHIRFCLAHLCEVLQHINTLDEQANQEGKTQPFDRFGSWINPTSDKSVAGATTAAILAVLTIEFGPEVAKAAVYYADLIPTVDSLERMVGYALQSPADYNINVENIPQHARV